MDAAAELYITLRDQIIDPHRFAGTALGTTGHFATTGRYPSNLIQERAEVLPADQLGLRPSGHGDNPLLATGKFLISQTVECLLGSSSAPDVVSQALVSVASMAPFGGDFAGYLLRWDPVTADRWTDFEEPLFDGWTTGRWSSNFGLDGDGRYELLAPHHDWEGIRYLTEEQHKALPSDQDRKLWADARFDYFFDRRHGEPSCDEYIGLIAGLSFVSSNLSGDQRTRATDLLRSIGTYLAEHDYMLVRPNGGFAARGPALGLVLAEGVLARAFSRLIGGDFQSRHVSPTILNTAGVWKTLEPDWNALSAVTTSAEILLAPLLDGFFVPLTAGLGELVLKVLLDAGITPSAAGGAWAVANNLALFDCFLGDGASQNFGAGQEIAIGCLMRTVPAAVRQTILLDIIGVTAGDANIIPFIPLLAVTALGDQDRTFANQYAECYALRRSLGRTWGTWRDPVREASRESFSTAIALLHAAEADPASPNIRALEVQLAREIGKLGEFHRDYLQKLSKNVHPIEDVNPALDYLAAVALGWLHQRRQATRGLAVSSDLPSPPTAAELNRTAQQLTTKPPVPTPELPEIPLRGRFAQHKNVDVPPNAVGWSTGLFIRPFDDVSIRAVGTVQADGLFPPSFGPDGDTNSYTSANFPLTGDDARPWSLFGRIESYGAAFLIGSGFQHRMFNGRRGGELFLGVNIDKDTGSGSFGVTVDISSAEPTDAQRRQLDVPPVTYVPAPRQPSPPTLTRQQPQPVEFVVRATNCFGQAVEADVIFDGVAIGKTDQPLHHVIEPGHTEWEVEIGVDDKPHRVPVRVDAVPAEAQVSASGYTDAPIVFRTVPAPPSGSVDR